MIKLSFYKFTQSFFFNCLKRLSSLPIVIVVKRVVYSISSVSIVCIYSTLSISAVKPPPAPSQFVAAFLFVYLTIAILCMKYYVMCILLLAYMEV